MSVDLGVQVAGATDANGKFILSDSVRVPCEQLLSVPGFHDDPELNGLATLGYIPCCAGRGWTPSTDLAVWVKAADTYGVSAVYFFFGEKPGVQLGVSNKFVEGEGLPALQSALAQTLVAEGWRLGEGD